MPRDDWWVWGEHDSSRAWGEHDSSRAWCEHDNGRARAEHYNARGAWGEHDDGRACAEHYHARGAWGEHDDIAAGLDNVGVGRVRERGLLRTVGLDAVHKPDGVHVELVAERVQGQGLR